ncbi:hypothetical protein P154DRAFT_191962 [Amniculicola lignicola CBS 123094]|uniref:Peptidase M10 metallopeptidase domain-containing protein n=1 Tax=Amniculicola lignicola CBS 123094 TaxID=1392246 RepID=A0A6A5WJ66_9PLEO|nr:hypothetical protein P154DRAFT_191962 [Amniculicola lignicola CBS 123094]
MTYLIAFTALLSLSSASIVPRQASTLKTGSWLTTFTPLSPIEGSSKFRGPLRITSNETGTIISGDLYNGTTEANPLDGSPILPRANYYAFMRAKKYTAGSNGAFTLDIDAYRYRGLGEVNMYPRWEHDNAVGPSEPIPSWGDGWTVNLAPATAPSGFPADTVYFSGEVKWAANGTTLGTMTMGWVSKWVRRAKLEIGTVSGVPVPLNDNSKTRPWVTIFNEARYDYEVTTGKTDIPEPSNPDLPLPGTWKNEQQHAAVLQYRSPTNFDKEWKHYLLVVRRIQGVDRGAMIDDAQAYNGLPREGTSLSTDWVFGKHWDGTDDTVTNWGEATGKKFVDEHDAWYRTAVHEVGHFFNLPHPPTFSNDVMTDSNTFADAGRDGITPEPFPRNLKIEAFKLLPEHIYTMQHRPDTTVRPAFIEFGGANNDNLPPQAPAL